MDVLQEINLIIGHPGVILWYMKLLQELFSIGKQINLFLFTELIIFGLMNIILASPYNISKLQVPYSLGKILKVIFMIQTSST